MDRRAGVRQGKLPALPMPSRTPTPSIVDVDGKAPYDRASLDRLVGKIDEQMAKNRAAHVRREGQGARLLPEVARHPAQDPRGRRAARRRASRRNGSPRRPRRSTPAEKAHSDEQLKAFLKPLPAQTPEEALKTFETIPGFHMELVATEPLVHSPVAAAFDEDGNLYVAEMIDYPYKPQPGKDAAGHASGCCATPTATAASTRATSSPTAALARRRRALEGGRLRRRAARHLVLQGHRRRPRGRRPPQGLHRVRHAEPAGDASTT